MTTLANFFSQFVLRVAGNAMLPEVPDGRGAALPPNAPAVEFDAVSFGYVDMQPVLHDVSFQLAPRAVLGLLGRTGSGKTIITRMIARLYDPTAGAVRLAGVDLRELRLVDLRRRVGVVTQDVQLFRASVRDNLADASAVHVTYERAACTHAAERVDVELVGTEGAARWDWLLWKRRGEVALAHDDGGKLVTEATEHSDAGAVGFMEKPLFFFLQRVRGEPSPAIVDAQAVFNFACVRAIYDCAATGEPQTVVAE